MSKTYKNILECIGNTPLVEIQKMSCGSASLFAKLEYFNPAGSVKDRIALAMIEDMEDKGLLKAGGLIIEPTSGNTGVALALVAAVKGYRLILTMPDTMSIERRTLLSAYGAKLVLTEGSKGMRGAIDKALELQSVNPGSIIPQQFENQANPQAHYKTTGEEIWRDTGGKIDILVSGVGTGGTLTGAGGFLRERNPDLKIVAVEPDKSPVLSGGTAGPHKIQGLGAGFIPEVLNTQLIDEVFCVTAAQAGMTARDAACEEGLLLGISAGAALYAALEISKRKSSEGKNIVVVLPDSGERYLSTWLYE